MTKSWHPFRTLRFTNQQQGLTTSDQLPVTNNQGPNTKYLLAIESSCDDTAAAVLRGPQLLSSVVASQLEHVEFGGVVPEVASRAHQRVIVPVVEQALSKASLNKHELDAVAVTYGPGLAGSLLVGLSFAKGLAIAKDIPMIGVNHIEGHMYSVFLNENKPEFPYLCMTVSGGHTELTIVGKDFKHEKLGKTRDDAAGEAFDKVGKMLGLPYPGGPIIDLLAKDGDPKAHRFPRTFLGDFDFSFSGIKTSVLYYLDDLGKEKRENLNDQELADICASFQAAVIEMLIKRIEKGLQKTGIRHLAIVGGVSSNSELKRQAQNLADRLQISLYIPDLRFCTDNAAMIGITAHMKYAAGFTSPLSLTAVPNLSLASAGSF